MSDLAQSQPIQQRDNEIFLWIIWAALGLSSFAEVVLTSVTSPPSHISLSASVDTLTGWSPTLLFLLGLGAVFASAIIAAFNTSFGGGGIATALVCWFLAKGIAVSGISVYFIYEDPLLSGMFTVSFLLFIGLLHPRHFMTQA